MTDFVDVAAQEELPPGCRKIVDVRGRPVALFNVEGTLYAIDNVCLHRGGPLGEGRLEGTILTCPWHAWTFDVRTGQCTFISNAKVDSFEVRVENGRVWVKGSRVPRRDDGSV